MNVEFCRETRQGNYWRRWVLGASLTTGLGLATLAPAVHATAFSMSDVERLARNLAREAYRPPPDRTPAALRALDYDAYRDIRYKPDLALWRNARLPFELMFYPTGRQFHDAVRLHEVSPTGAVKPLKFDATAFDFGRNRFGPEAVKDMDFAGFRVHAALNRRDYKDEVLSFLGASYFRGLGKGQHYGLSARGLALDTGEAKGEQFPRFTEYWIVRPAPDSKTLSIYALLDAPAATGAYRFTLEPGVSSSMLVQAKLFARDPGAKFGLAPLTSMYTFGENQPGRNDYRPEVHDSDGLQIQLGDGEWIWRPLVNPKRLLITSFATQKLRGFGLMQRDRAFSSYEDPEARYELRPSAWVEPVGRWDAGRVELVQIPSPDETNDNVVAYWVPDRPAGREGLSLSYRLHWQMERETRPPLSWVTQTRVGRGYVRQPDGHLKFVLEFDGPALKGLKADAELAPEVTLGGNAELAEKNLFRNEATGVWRMTIRLKPVDPTQPIELRARLRLRDEIASETWSYIVPPEPEKS